MCGGGCRALLHDGLGVVGVVGGVLKWSGERKRRRYAVAFARCVSAGFAPD